MRNVISLPVRAETKADARSSVSRREVTKSPVTSLALLLRGAPAALQPAAVANAILATQSSAGAIPVWAELKLEFYAMVASRGIRGVDAISLMDEWRALVRVEGIAEKARRRAAEGKVFRLFERLADGVPGGGDVA